MKKLTDISKLNNLGWRYTMNIEEGTKALYSWYLNRKNNF